MRDPFHDLLTMHEASASYGCALRPELLDYIHHRSDHRTSLRQNLNVVLLEQTRAHSGSPSSASEQDISTNPDLLRFPNVNTP